MHVLNSFIDEFLDSLPDVLIAAVLDNSAGAHTKAGNEGGLAGLLVEDNEVAQRRVFLQAKKQKLEKVNRMLFSF